MVDYKTLDYCGIHEVLVNAEPLYVFEYEKSAWEFLEEVDGEDVAKIYYTSRVQLWGNEDTGRFIGYGVIKDGELV